MLGVDQAVAFDHRQRKGRIDDGHLRISPLCFDWSSRPVVALLVGDCGGELRGEKVNELARGREREGDIVGVDVLHVVGDLIAVSELPAFDRLAG